MTERGVKLRRIVVLCVGAAFLLVLIGATIYCQTGYVSKLPVVQLGRPEKGCLPLDAVLDTGEEVYFHYVQQEEGPWGQRYILRRSQAYNYMDMGDGTMLVYEAATLEEPIVLSASVPLEVLIDGMEVRLG